MQSLPGLLELELYDTGGDSIAYHDKDSVNQGNGKLNTGTDSLSKFRANEGVDLSFTKAGLDVDASGNPETPGETYVGWIVDGEWLSYSVKIDSSGTYSVSGHMAAAAASQISFSLDGADQSGPIDIAPSGGTNKWNAYSDFGRLTLVKGEHVLTVRMVKGNTSTRKVNLNIDNLQFTKKDDAGIHLAPRAARQIGGAPRLEYLGGYGMNGRALDVMGRIFEAGRRPDSRMMLVGDVPK